MDNTVTDLEVAKTMLIFGSGFSKALATAYMVADSENSKKIRETWPELWKVFRERAEWQKEWRQL